MNENDFRNALHGVMDATPAPPPMSDGPVLDAAKRDGRRRRALWAGAGSAASVTALVVGAVLIGSPGSDGGGGGLQVGAGQNPSSDVISATPESDLPRGTAGQSDAPPADESKPEWPDGQTDRTASSGPRFDKGATLLESVIGAAPDGYTTPDLPAPEGWHGELKYHQAQFADWGQGDVEIWEYMASTPLVQGDRVGQLMIQVTTPGNTVTGDGCDLSETLWGMQGTCTEVAVDGKRVGVWSGGDQFDQWAGYRHEDGTVVMVAQNLDYEVTGKPALTALPIGAERLAELATEDQFHLD
ncbi:hypothetical protein [Actinophytocola xanthii]|uniref:Uncharacterized protein n=1 Tax=Actinophytocola xanthii TaxID=1912961 RepID=A0A1Q8CMR9_9PSEU|nr:hypothetical protein [Actinophytocola xanthii]OLF15663.1 hypothetical protein BU204_20715 [Actinophytocola xanthii]